MLQDANAVDLDQEKKSPIVKTHLCIKDEVECAISQIKNSFRRKI